MEQTDALARLAALAHDTRLSLFRHLVKAGPAGEAAGSIAAALELPASTFSFHVAHLERSGLVVARKDGRSILYSADYGAMQQLVAFLYENCCTGGACSPPSKPARAVRKKS